MEVEEEVDFERRRAWMEVGEEEGGLKKKSGSLLSAATSDPPDSWTRARRPRKTLLKTMTTCPSRYEERRVPPFDG